MSRGKKWTIFVCSIVLGLLLASTVLANPCHLVSVAADCQQSNVLANTEPGQWQIKVEERPCAGGEWQLVHLSGLLNKSGYWWYNHTWTASERQKLGGSTKLQVSLLDSGGAVVDTQLAPPCCCLYCPPTAVKIASSAAGDGLGGVQISWDTGSEINNLGFNLYRTAESAFESASRVHLGWFESQSPGSTIGASYGYLDASALEGTTYYYWLEDVEAVGDTQASGIHGPISGQWNKPRTGAVTPNSGGKSYTKVQTFTATFSDADGDLGVVSLKFSGVVTASYNLATKKAAVIGATFKGYSITGDGYNLTVTWKIKFPKSRRGTYQLALSAVDKPGNESGWNPAGSWQVK